MAGTGSWLRLPFALRKAHTVTEPPILHLCRTVSESALQAALAAKQDTLGWDRVSSHHDTEIWCKKDFTDYHKFKRCGSIPASPQRILSFLLDPANARKWNETLQESRLLKTVEPYTILYQKTALPWPLKARDFVLAAGGGDIKGGTAYTLTSVEVEDAPIRRDVVRGHIDYAAVIAIDNLKGGSDVTFISSLKLNEELPHRVVYHLIKKRNSAIVRLREMITEDW